MLFEFFADGLSTVACCTLALGRTLYISVYNCIKLSFLLCLFSFSVWLFCVRPCESALMARVFHPSGPGSYDPVESW